MDESIPINLDIIYGHIELRMVEKREGDDLMMGGFSIHYGRDGRETKRTPVEWYTSLVGYYDPRCWGYEPSAWARFTNWIRAALQSCPSEIPSEKVGPEGIEPPTKGL